MSLFHGRNNTLGDEREKKRRSEEEGAGTRGGEGTERKGEGEEKRKLGRKTELV